MTDINLEAEGFQPVNKAPSLTRIYGIGTGLYGQRRLNPDSPLFIRYYCFCVLFIPIVVLGKYLVQRSDGSEYVIAKGSLGKPVRTWNIAILFVALFGGSGFGLYTYVQSPAYIAQQSYDRGMAAAEAGNYTSAMPQLLDAYHSDTKVSDHALRTLMNMGKPAYLDAQAPLDSAVILEALISLNKPIPQALKSADTLFKRYRATEPLAANRLAGIAIRLSEDATQIEKYQEAQYRLMAQVVKQYPQSAEYAVEFALLDEIFSACGACESLLTAHENALGDGEGARLLGQIFATNGEIEKAYQLLSAYTQPRLKTYHQVSREYEQVTESLWEDMIAHLNGPNAPPEFVENYNQASEQEQGQMLDDYYLQHLDGSRRFQDVKLRYRQATSIVPVALNLGIVMLNRATATADAALRQEQLAAAEQTFLAVKDEAAGSDDYQWYLGQVYYWLGKEQEGQALFDGLLGKYDRSSSVLYSLSSVLRDLGASAAAREMAEEGYEKSQDTAEKQNFAHQLALLSTELDERIEWMEKSNPASPFTQAGLSSLRARQASEAGDDERALQLLDEAIATYKTIPEDSTVLNNIALIYMNRYRLTRSHDDYNLGLASLDQAVALEPDGSIVLSNALDYHLNKAYRDILSKHINLEVLKLEPDDDLLAFLYQNQAQKDQLVTELLKHPSMQKALNHTNKVLLLAPKNSEILVSSYSLYHLLGKTEELEALANRVAPMSFDLRRAEKEVADFRQGVHDAGSVTAYKDRIANLEQMLANLEASQQLESTVLKSYLVQSYIDLSGYNEPVDLDAAKQLALNNFAAHPSAETAANLQEILMIRATEFAREKTPKFASYYTQYHRYLDRTTLLALAMDEVPGFAQTITTNEDFMAFVAISEQDVARFPKRASLAEWYMLKKIGHDLAAPLGQIIKDNSIQHLATELRAKTSAHYEYTAAMRFFAYSALGQAEQAKAVLVEAANRKLQLPASFLANGKAI